MSSAGAYRTWTRKLDGVTMDPIVHDRRTMIDNVPSWLRFLQNLMCSWLAAYSFCLIVIANNECLNEPVHDHPIISTATRGCASVPSHSCCRA